MAEVLREAAGEGRIDLDELDERLDATFAARTYADLVPITLDLPATPAAHQPRAVRGETAPAPSPVVPGPAEERHLAILGGLDRRRACGGSCRSTCTSSPSWAGPTSTCARRSSPRAR